MSVEYNEVSLTVPDTNYTKALFLQTLRELKRPTTSQALSAGGVIDLSKLVTLLSSVGADYVATLPDGAEANERKELYFTGSAGTFQVNGTLQDFTSLNFDTGARSAVLFWVNSKWMLVGGNCRPN